MVATDAKEMEDRLALIEDELEFDVFVAVADVGVVEGVDGVLDLLAR